MKKGGSSKFDFIFLIGEMFEMHFFSGAKLRIILLTLCELFSGELHDDFISSFHSILMVLFHFIQFADTSGFVVRPICNLMILPTIAYLFTVGTKEVGLTVAETTEKDLILFLLDRCHELNLNVCIIILP